MLTVLVDGCDPVAARRGHAGEGGSVLTEIPGEPDRADPVVRGSEAPNDLIASAGAAIPYKEHLGDSKRSAIGGEGRPRQRFEFLEECGKGLLPLIHGDDDADLKRRRLGRER